MPEAPADPHARGRSGASDRSVQASGITPDQSPGQARRRADAAAFGTSGMLTIVRSASMTVLLALLVGCGDDGGGDTPDRLYLSLLDSELTVQLVEVEPEPY
jgi:hypothetical protein